MHSKKSSKIVAELSRPYRARVCKGLRPLRLIASASKRDSVSKVLTTAKWPSLIATCKALSPSESTASNSAPFCSSALTTASWPDSAATCSGVRLCASLSLGYTKT